MFSKAEIYLSQNRINNVLWTKVELPKYTYNSSNPEVTTYIGTETQEIIVTGDDDGLVTVWKYDGIHFDLYFKVETGCAFNVPFAVNSCTKTLFTRSLEDHFIAIDLVTGAPLKTYKVPEDIRDSLTPLINAFLVMPNCSHIFIFGMTHSLAFDSNGGFDFDLQNYYKNTFRAASSEGSDYIAIGNTTGEISITDSCVNRLINTYKFHDDYIFDLAFNKTDTYVINVSGDGSIFVLDRRMPQGLKLVERAHDDSIRSISIAKNNYEFISGSTDKTVKFWDIRSAKGPIEIFPHLWPVWCARYSWDYKSFISVSSHGLVNIIQKHGD